MMLIRNTVCAVLLFASFFVEAGDKVYTGFLSNKALSGYDAVAYFTESKPVKGDEKYQLEYQGADWYFVSEENLNAFKAQPERYAPQYGGFCAWAVSAKNSRAPGDPKHWRIVDGKLYLNYNKTVQEKWLSDTDGHIKQANKNWPGLIEKP